jgi:hypothetical protein
VSPIAAATADSASSTGTVAASNAPKVSSRISSVTGRLNSSARLKSSPNVSLSALSIDPLPTSSTRSDG